MSDFQVAAKKIPPDIALIEVKGPLSGENALALNEVVRKVIEKNFAKFIFDLAGVTSVSSTMLGNMVLYLDVLHGKDGALVVAGLSPKVRAVFDLTHMTSQFPCVDNVEQAAALLSGKPVPPTKHAPRNVDPAREALRRRALALAQGNAALTEAFEKLFTSSSPDEMEVQLSYYIPVCPGAARHREAVSEIFQAFLDDRRQEVRVGAIQGLGALRVRRVAPKIAGFLEDPNPVIRFAALRALEALRAIDSAPAIVHRIGDTDEKVRRAALDTLRTFPRGTYQEAVRPYLADRDASVRSAVEKLLEDAPCHEPAKDVPAKLALHRRSTWIPIVKDGDGPPTASKIAGLPWLSRDEEWPRCPECRRAMLPALQLNIEELPEPMRRKLGSGLLQFFYSVCDCFSNWEPFSRNKLVRVIQPIAPGKDPFDFPDDILMHVDYPPRIITGWSELQEHASQENWDEPGNTDWHCFVFRGDKLGGWPSWTQTPDYPQCAECRTPMEFLYQICADGGPEPGQESHLPNLFASDGTGHIFRCPKHTGLLTFTWDCG